MCIEDNWKKDIDTQEEYEYHEPIIKSFISRLEDELYFYNSRFPHKTLTFQYYNKVGKFKEIDIPFECKNTFYRVKETSHKLRQYWL